MDSLQRRVLLQRLLLGAVVVGLLAMLTWNAWRPVDNKADELHSVSRTILDTDWEEVTPEQRQEFRRQWQELPPETREEVFQQVARRRVVELRRTLDELTPEERADKIRERVERMRTETADLPADERAQIRERINSEEGQAMIRRVLELYMNEFTARERAELDPLVHEWLAHIEALASGR